MEPRDFKENGHLLIGGAGAIIAVNLPGYILFLRQNVCRNIRVILTRAACTFINKEAILYVSGYDALVTESRDPTFPAPHISLTGWADIFLVLPASANTFAKAAHGMADDLLSSAILGANCPIIFYPSMNRLMWEKPVMQRNVAILKEDGYHIKYKVETSLEVATGKTEANIVPDILSVGRDVADVLAMHEYDTRKV